MPVPRMRAGRFISFLAGLACAAALAGCESNPSPAPLPSESPPSASPSATSTPSPTPPAMPDAAKGTGEKSAKAFVRYYIGAVNFAMRTGNVEPVRSASSRGCRSCDGVAQNIEAVYSAGGRLEGRGWRVTALRPVSGQPKSKPILQIGVLVGPQDKFDSEQDANPEHFKGGQKLMTLFLARSSGGWHVVKWDQAQ
jgi:hypothetical protein